MSSPWVRPAVRRPGALVAAMVAIVVLIASCSSSEPVDDQEVIPPATATLTAEDLIDSLAGAGIQTFDEAGDSEPAQAVENPGAMSLTRWQAENMTTQLNDQRGFVGHDLDALTGGEVPISIVLAAYLTAAETPGADAARDLMGEQDYANLAQDIVYPNAVVAIFVNDIASDGSAGPSGDTASPALFGSGGTVAQPAMAYQAGICTTLSSFLSGSLDSIVSALQIDAQDGTVGGILAFIWNTAVSIAASAAQLALSALTAPVINFVKGAISILAVLSSASSLLVPWDIDITASTNPTSFGVDPAPGNVVEVRAHVNTAVDFKWPADLVDCASNVGIVLPDPGSAKDSPIEWEYKDLAEVTKKGPADTVVDEAGDATLQFTTLTESQEAAEKGALIVSMVTVAPYVKRTAITELTNLLATVMLDKLPGPVRGIVDQLLGPVKSEAQQQLTDLLKVSGQLTAVSVEHHGPPPPEDPAVPGEDPPAEECEVGGPNEIPSGVFKGPIAMNVRGQGFNGQADSVGKGMMIIQVKDRQVTGGTWSVGWRSVGDVSSDGITTRIDVMGAISGSVKGNAQVPFLKGSWSIDGFATLSIGGGKLPLNFSGDQTVKLKIESTSCGEVTGSFIPSFNSKAASGVSFSGIARWTGTRVDVD